MQQINALLFLIALIGSLGLFTLAASLLPFGRQIFLSRVKSNQLENFSNQQMGQKELPLAARIFSSLSLLVYRLPGVEQLSEESLEAQLLRAGLPYYSPAHFYSHMFYHTLLYAGATLLGLLFASAFINISPLWLILITLIVGGWGSAQVGADLKNHLKRRRDELLIDMAFSLKRLILNLDALGSIQNAITRTTTEIPRGKVSAKAQELLEKNKEYLSAENTLLMGEALEGFGGNLFIEAIDRFAAELAMGVDAGDAARKVSKFYPRSIQLDNFFNTVVAGLAGKVNISARLNEMLVGVRQELELKVEERAAKAKLFITGMSAAAIMAVFAEIMLPLFISMANMFN